MYVFGSPIRNTANRERWHADRAKNIKKRSSQVCCYLLAASLPAAQLLASKRTGSYVRRSVQRPETSISPSEGFSLTAIGLPPQHLAIMSSLFIFSSSVCSQQFSISVNCSLIPSDDNTTLISVGQYGFGDFPGDPDIAGIGVCTQHASYLTASRPSANQSTGRLWPYSMASRS